MDYHQHARLTVFSREQMAKKVLKPVEIPQLGGSGGTRSTARRTCGTAARDRTGYAGQSPRSRSSEWSGCATSVGPGSASPEPPV